MSNATLQKFPPPCGKGPGIVSLLDNDLYKLSMQQAVLKLYPDVQVTYQYRNRSPETHRYTEEAFQVLLHKIMALRNLTLTSEEQSFLRTSCPYFSTSYMDYLSNFRFRPDEQIHIRLLPSGDLEIKILGLWHETILYEVPILALVSETYFECVDRDWNLVGQKELAEEKARKLILGGCHFTDFGTRRRRAGMVQDIVVEAMSRVHYQLHDDRIVRNTEGNTQAKDLGSFGGTSNVYLAMKYKLQAVGTVAHEWVMAVSVLEGDLLHANGNAYRKWREAYPSVFGTALTDTYSTRAFLNDFDAELATSYEAVRQDSGNPYEFVRAMVYHYDKFNIDPGSKSIVFSDSLDVDKCLALQQFMQRLQKERGKSVPNARFGIGTNLTNDFTRASNGQKVKAMNIVIKLYECASAPVVKLSDDVEKHQGQESAVREAIKVFACS